MSRTDRAHRQFLSTVRSLIQAHAPRESEATADRLATTLKQASPSNELWPLIEKDCEAAFGHNSHRLETLSQAIEWETLKLQSRLQLDLDSPRPPVFRDGHVHIGALIQFWRRLALEAEEALAAQGIDTLLDVGPWGGFNFALQSDGYTRMKFARLTLGVGSLPTLPLQDNGGPFFVAFLPRYRTQLAVAGVSIPDEWGFHHPKRDALGQLLELSCIYYFPNHTYERRSFVKVRVSREYETVEEIILRDFVVLLERLHYQADWQQYRESTQNVDARFDLQDFISLSHVVEGVYRRTEAEEALLNEIKDAFKGAIREPTVLYGYWDKVVRSKWIEHLYWAIAEAGLGVRKYQRPVMLGRELFPKIPPRLLIPVRRHLQAYHRKVGSQQPT
jgi:hypothetical protein